MDKVAAEVLTTVRDEEEFVKEALVVFKLNDEVLSECMKGWSDEVDVKADLEKSDIAIEIGRISVGPHRNDAARRILSLTLAAMLVLLLLVAKIVVPPGWDWFF
jgi:hypothetical protein